MQNPCADIWDLADWLTLEQAASLWGCGDQQCIDARTAAISGAVERGEIETRDAATRPRFGFGSAEGLAKGWLEVSRVSLSLWAEGLPEGTRPKDPIQRAPRMDESHLRLLFALAKRAGVDVREHGSAARLREISEQAGMSVSQDSAERIVNKLKTFAR